MARSPQAEIPGAQVPDADIPDAHRADGRGASCPDRVLEPEVVAAAVDALRWPEPRWDHRAHLSAGAWWAHRLGPGALDHARLAISRYNESNGNTNTADSGYHETITAYFLAALAVALDGAVPTGASWQRTVGHELLDPRAPLRFWTTEVLMGRAARAAWRNPDREPLPPALAQVVAGFAAHGRAA